NTSAAVIAANPAYNGWNFANIQLNNLAYPQDIRNCDTCHVTTANPSFTPPAQANNWQTTPNRAACGGCHDNVNFITGLNHGPNNLEQPDDSQCQDCHGSQVSDTAGYSTIALLHLPVWSP